jgi:hypothetical protein
MPKHSVAAVGDWYDDMRRLFDAAKFREAGQIYDDAVEKGIRPLFDAQLPLLRARVLFKENQHDTVASLLRHRQERATAHERGLRSLYLGIGYARMRDFQQADRHFADARSALHECADRATVAYQMGRQLRLEGRADEVSACIDEMAYGDSIGTRVDQELLRCGALSQE